MYICSTGVHARRCASMIGGPGHSDPSLWCLYWPVDQQSIDRRAAQQGGVPTTADAVARHLGVTTNISYAASVEQQQQQQAGASTFWHLRMDPWVLALLAVLVAIQAQFFAGGDMDNEAAVLLVLAYAASCTALSNCYFSCIGLLASLR